MYHQGLGKEKDENHADLCLRSNVFSFEGGRMFHPSYQNGGKILSIVKPPVGRR